MKRIWLFLVSASFLSLGGVAHAGMESVSAFSTNVYARVEGVLSLTGEGSAKSKVHVGELAASARLELSGVEAIIARAEDGSTIFAGGDCRIDIQSGACRLLSRIPDAEVLGEHPLLWLDASAAETLVQYENYVYTNSYPVISTWYDCRFGAQSKVYAENTRGDGYQNVYPYLMTDALGGKGAVSMGSVAGTLLPSQLDIMGSGRRRRIVVCR